MSEKYNLKIFELFLKELDKNKIEYIIIDNRFLPFISGLYKFKKNFFALNSIKILLKWIQNSKYYPSWSLRIKYEDLSKKWLEIDLLEWTHDTFIKYDKESFFFHWYKVFIDRNKYFIELDNFEIDFKRKEWLVCYLDAWNRSLFINFKKFKMDYIEYIKIVNNINRWNYKVNYVDKLKELYLFPKLIVLKVKIKYIKLLLNAGYKTLEEVFNWKKINLKKIKYYKNISVKKEKYIWKVHKVYNVVSSKEMKEWYIMVAENTNPEFIDAFYKASFIAVETDSELSHAAITCKELKIPLALWAKNIFFATKNWQEININTKKKVIYL